MLLFRITADFFVCHVVAKNKGQAIGAARSYFPPKGTLWVRPVRDDETITINDRGIKTEHTVGTLIQFYWKRAPIMIAFS